VIFAIFTKACRVFLPFFAVIFYCPYATQMAQRKRRNGENNRLGLGLG